MNILLGILTVLLVLICVFMVLMILAQRAKSDGGVGAALGGGMAEAAFGGESGNVLSRFTTYAAIAFFVLCFGLYLGRIYQHRQQGDDGLALPTSPTLMPAASGAEGSTIPPLPETLPMEASPSTVPTEQPSPADATETPPAAPAPSNTETPAP